MVGTIVQEVTSAIVAVASVVGAFAIVSYEIVNGKPITIPDFVSLLIGAVVGSYLTRVASVNGARQAGTAAAQTAIQSNKDAVDAASIRTTP